MWSVVAVIGAVAGEALFKTAVHFKDEMVFHGVNVKFHSESCLLAGHKIAAMFTRSRITDAEGYFLPTLTPYQASFWRLTSVTCPDGRTHVATNSNLEEGLLMRGISPDTCEQLLREAVPLESLASKKAIAKCMPHFQVSKKFREAILAQVQRLQLIKHRLEAPVDPDVSLDFVSFSAEYNRVIGYNGAYDESQVACEQRVVDNVETLTLEKTKRGAIQTRIVFSVPNDQEMKIPTQPSPNPNVPAVAVKRGTLNRLECRGVRGFEMNQPMPMFFLNPDNAVCGDDKLQRDVDVDILCATIEDLTQRVYSVELEGFGSQYCYIESKGMATNAVFKRQPGGNWLFEEVHCGMPTAENYTRTITRDHMYLEYLASKPDLFLLIAAMEARMVVTSLYPGQFGTYSGFRMSMDSNFDKLIPECMANRIDMFSGLSFNRLCERRNF